MTGPWGAPAGAAAGAAAAARPRALVVEDEVMVALHVEELLEELGYEVVAVATRLEEALAIAADGAAETLSVAVLDVNLGGRASFPVAAALRARGVPFVFATAYGAAGVAAPFGDAPVIDKPFALADLAAALERARTGARDGAGGEGAPAAAPPG